MSAPHHLDRRCARFGIDLPALLRRRDYPAAVRQPGETLNIIPSMRSEWTRRATRHLDGDHAPVIAAGKTSRRTGDGLTVGRPRCSRQKIVRVLAGGKFLLVRAVRIH